MRTQNIGHSAQEEIIEEICIDAFRENYEMSMEAIEKEICKTAVTRYGRAIQYVPEKFITKEMYFDAVKENGRALKYIDISRITSQEYTELCRLAMERVSKY